MASYRFLCILWDIIFPLSLSERIFLFVVCTDNKCSVLKISSSGLSFVGVDFVPDSYISRIIYDLR